MLFSCSGDSKQTFNITLIATYISINNWNETWAENCIIKTVFITFETFKREASNRSVLFDGNIAWRIINSVNTNNLLLLISYVESWELLNALI